MSTLSLTLAATRPIRYTAPVRLLRGIVRYRVPVGALREIGRFFASIAAAQRATVDYERMNNRTDTQLCNEGMRRADVARGVFERHFD